MTDKEISKLNEVEFDRYLEDILDAPPAPAIASITPWRTAMNRVLWGFGLYTLTLNFLALDTILPAVGLVLQLLGFRALRRENQWFRLAYGICWLRLAWFFTKFTLNLWVCAGDEPVKTILTVGTYGALLPGYLMWVALRGGIRGVQKKAGLPPHGGNGLLVWYPVSVVLALLNTTGIVALAMILAYCGILWGLCRLSRELSEAGYCIAPAPVRISDRVVKIGYATAILACMVLGYGFLGKYPMDWTPAETVQTDESTQIRQELRDLGFPDDVLSDMTEEEILTCRGAERVLVDVDDSDGGLRITSIGVQFTGEQVWWRLIHHFRWQEDTDFCGTESLMLTPADRAYRADSWYRLREYQGRVLCDWEGETITAPYYSLGPVTYENDSFLSSMAGETSTQYFATFSFPAGACNARGYVYYDLLELNPGCLIDSWCEYAHQLHVIQYPVQTAMEYQQVFLGRSDAFSRFFDQLLIDPTEEEPELHGY